METFKVVLLSLWMKSYGVTIQTKPLLISGTFTKYYLYLSIFQMSLGLVLNSHFGNSWE